MNDEFMKAAFSSATGQWDTPQSLIDDLAPLFPWDLDVCASRPNVCRNYYDESHDALKATRFWHGLCWMNPPYGRAIGRWIKKALTESDAPYTVSYAPYTVSWPTTVVCLVPARTDTRWWHDYVPLASQVVFIKGRLKFGDATNSAPFPSAFVVFGGLKAEQQCKLDKYGWGVRPYNSL